MGVACCGSFVGFCVVAKRGVGVVRRCVVDELDLRVGFGVVARRGRGVVRRGVVDELGLGVGFGVVARRGRGVVRRGAVDELGLGAGFCVVATRGRGVVRPSAVDKLSFGAGFCVVARIGCGVVRWCCCPVDVVLVRFLHAGGGDSGRMEVGIVTALTVVGVAVVLVCLGGIFFFCLDGARVLLG